MAGNDEKCYDFTICTLTKYNLFIQQLVLYNYEVKMWYSTSGVCSTRDYFRI